MFISIIIIRFKLTKHLNNCMIEKKKSRIISVDDIDRLNKQRQREQTKNDIAEDINDVMSKVGFSINMKGNKKKKSITKRILIGLGIILLLLVAINFLFANIWLLKFFLGDFAKTIASWFG